ncbi:MAG: substrate-binding domain-containing protein [Capsulimonas sp.]|uniref:substrate-binding domain-containing protein n=1 Tax=Capsulimonas sp. TaxID=2494211 RepID=UPI00326381D3
MIPDPLSQSSPEAPISVKRVSIPTGDRVAAWAYRARISLLCAAVFAAMSVLAPNFLTLGNLASIFKGMSTNLYAAIGLTIVLIAGQLDLSIGALMTIGGMAAIGLQPRLGWGGAFAVAALLGVIVGAVNGLLVTKAKISSFIVTLGTMTILGGAANLYSKGGTLFVSDFSFADRLDPAGMLLTPRVLLSLAALVLCAVLLRRTAAGRGVYLIGGSARMAWYSGLPVDTYIIGAFMVSGLLSALGGALFAASLNSANPSMGDRSLMPVIAAVIIGGASMKGGKGSVVESAVAVLTLVALINGLACLGAGFEVQQIASGAVLASVVAYDAWRAVQANAVRGQRKELLSEFRDSSLASINDEDDITEESNLLEQRKDRTFAMACVAMVACVAIVAIYALSMHHSSGTEPRTASSASSPASVSAAIADADAAVMKLKAIDGQPLIAMDDAPLNAPPRPANPDALPLDDPMHWYDQEYAGWSVARQNMPKSPGGPVAGRKVLCLRFMDHPYLTAYTRGMQKVADAYGIQLTTLVANNDINIQSQQVDQAINERPDLVIITPVDATAVVPLLRKLNQAGVPVIASNLMPIAQGTPYELTWTGPDDWGNTRMLAREFAKRMNYEGGYCIVRHMPGSAPFFSRTYAMVTELKKIAPKMVCLDMQSTGLEAEKTMQVVSDWITRYGTKLKGITSADDSGSQIGIDQAVANAHRSDIVRVAAGSSKVGMDAVKKGELAAVTSQAAESDGALPMKLAADWLSGKPIERPVYYLKKQLITQENVGQFQPAQW